VKMYLNVYRSTNRQLSVVHAGGLFPTREAADSVAKPYRAACVEVEIPNHVIDTKKLKKFRNRGINRPWNSSQPARDTWSADQTRSPISIEWLRSWESNIVGFIEIITTSLKKG
jgi:hypothetical protein